MYIYKIKLTTRNSGTDMRFIDMQQTFNEAVTYYNKIDGVNPKKITEVKFGRNTINLTLSSNQRLTAVGRALKALSSYLMQTKEFETYCGGLFRYTIISETIVETDMSDNEKKYCATDLVKSLVDYIAEGEGKGLSYKERERKKKAINRMIAIGIENNIVK